MKVLIVPHTGLGDQLIMNGYVNYLLDKRKDIEHIKITVRKIHESSVVDMYSENIQNKKISFLYFDERDELRDVLGKAFNSTIMLDNTEYLVHSFGIESNDQSYLYRYHWIDSFYHQAGCNPSIRKQYFKMPTRLPRSVHNYNLLNNIINNSEYIIIHDDPSRDCTMNYSMVKQILMKNNTDNLPIIYLGIDRYSHPVIQGLNNIVLNTNIKTSSDFKYPYITTDKKYIQTENKEYEFNNNSIFDWYHIIKNCKEGHFMDSSYIQIALNIKDRVGTYYCHDYIRKSNASHFLDNTWVII